MSTRAEQIEKTVEWLQDKVKEAHARGLIVGVSGGIDSAVVAYLIKKACPNDSMGVIMSIKSNPADRVDAMKVIDGCGIEYMDLELAEPHKLILDTVTDNLKEKGLFKEEYLRMTDAILELE